MIVFTEMVVYILLVDLYRRVRTMSHTLLQLTSMVNHSFYSVEEFDLAWYLRCSEHFS
jgi:hypothetical protein